MIDDSIRIGFLALAGLAVTLIAVWLLDLVYQEIAGTGQIVIDQFNVVRLDGKTDSEFGRGLAQGLQARLQLLTRELQDAQAGLSTENTASEPGTVVAARKHLGLSNIIPPGGISTTLLSPVELKLSVAGVDVGGLIPWLQRKFTSYRTLSFTISVEDNRAEVFGSLAPLRLTSSGINLTVYGDNGKPPSLTQIADLLAHDILRRYYLYLDPQHRLESLNAKEFESLSRVIIDADLANREAMRGRRDPEEFSKLLPDMFALCSKAPSWPELGYLAAWIADSAGDAKNAIKYYGQARPKFAETGNNDVVKWIDDRVTFLTALSSTEKSQSNAPPTAEHTLTPLPPSVDYSPRIRIRDMGQEGSSVGQALAAALEFKLATKNIDQRISARFIYNAARELEGSLKTDSGAQLSDGFTVLEKQGAVTEAVWPYQPGKFAEPAPPTVEKAERFRISAFQQVKGVDGIKRVLNENPPVIAGITVFSEMFGDEVTKTGVVPLPTKASTVMGGHAVVLVGYDDKTQRFKFANSWGTGWGDKGFGYLPYGYVDGERVEAWTFTLP
jgi:Papain family cysteine protease